MAEVLLESDNFATPEHHQKYSVTDAVRLIINSFRFSQGDTILQKNLLEQIGYMTYGKLDRATVEQAIGPATEVAAKILSSRKLHSRTESIAYTSRKEVTEYANFLADQIKDYQPDTYPLTTKLIQRDYKFVNERTGGRERAVSSRITPATDPYLSHFVYYGLMKQSTGTPEYDQIFAEAVRTYEEDVRPSNPEYAEIVNQLVETYTSHHPDQIDLLPEQYRPVAQAA